MTFYTFWIETDAGKHIEWRGLSLNAALGMYRATEKRLPDGVKHFGWGESK